MDGKVVIGTELSTEQIDKQIDLLYGKLDELVKEYEALENEEPFENQANELLKLGSEINATKNKIQKLVKEKDRLNNPPSDLMNWIRNFGKETTKVTKRVIGIGLALFGIRSAYGFLLSSMNTLSSYNKQMQTDIQYIKFALASTLQPVVERLIQLAYQLLSAFGSVIKAITGINIFKNSGIDKFQKGLDASVGSAKDLKKQLAGFDEMNVLQDTSSGGGGGGASATLPSMDLSQIKDTTLPSWLDEVASAILGIVTAIGLLLKKVKFVKALGIGLIVAGVTYAIIGLIKYLKDPSWENFGQIVTGIGIAVIGLGIAFFGLPVIIAGVITTILGIIITNWETIKAFFVGIYTWLYEQATNIGGLPGLIVESVGQLVEIIISTLGMIIDGLKRILDGIIGLVKAVIDGDFSAILDSLLQIILGVLEVIGGAIANVVGIVLSILKTAFLLIAEIFYELFKTIVGISDSVTKGIESAINFVINLFKFFGQVIVLSMKQAFDGIKNVFSSIGSFFSNIISKIMGMFKTIGTTAGNVIGNAFKSVVNGVLGAIESILNTPIKTINSLIGTINKVPGINLGKLSTFRLPRLAKGGIVNMPGRGINYGGANIGERRPEGVIPYTDNQVMSLLGKEIGKNVVINATITNTMNGRVISRELKKVNAENDFAYNK